MTYNDADIEEDMALLAEPAQDLNIGFGFSSSFATSKKEKKKRPQVLKRIRFHDIVYKVPYMSKFKNICKIRPNKILAEDYTPIFLGHAQLYVLAEKWDIKPLKALVLSKLHAILYEYKPYKARYGDIIKLIRYTYKHTPCRKRMDPLRELVT